MTGTLIELAFVDRSTPLIFLPSAARTPLSLVRFSRALKPRRAFYSFEYAGLDGDSQPDNSVAQTAARVVQNLSELDLSEGVILGGQCFGGTVAYEMDRQLRGANIKVNRLLLLDAIPTRLLRLSDAPTDSPTQSELEEDRFKAEAVESVYRESQRQFVLLPEEMQPRFENILRIQVEASRQYRTKPTNTPVYLLRTKQYDERVFNGWHQLARGGFETVDIPGGSLSSLDPPHVAETTEKVSALLLNNRALHPNSA